MKKNNQNNLLAMLDASLKESPLAAHARGTDNNTQVSTNPAAKMAQASEANFPRKTLIVTTLGAEIPQNYKPSQQSSNSTPQSRDVAVAPKPTPTPAVKSSSYEKSKTMILSNSRDNMSADPTIVSSGINTPIPEPQKSLSQAPIPTANVQALKAAAIISDALHTGKPLKSIDVASQFVDALLASGAPITPEMIEQAKQLRLVAQSAIELEEIKKSIDAERAAAANPAPQVPMRLGSTRNSSQSGWRTSTVGLYPEDYDKARAIMNYLQQQTGEVINLSRVIKIALRALDVGPRALEINAQIRSKDGRMMTRRG